MNLEIIIPSDEPVRLLSVVLEEMDYSKLAATCAYIGRIKYSPRLLFKVVLYACTHGYISREVERACRENANFMYLLGCICWGRARCVGLQHHCWFRSRHLPEAVEDLLYQMVRILVQRLKKLRKRLYVKAEYEYESLVAPNSG